MKTITLQLTDNEVQSLLNALSLAAGQMDDKDREAELMTLAEKIFLQKRQQKNLTT